MTQYNTLKEKVSDSQLNKLKSGIKNGADVNLKLPSNSVSDSNDETNFPHKLLLRNTQISRLRKAFADGSSTNIKLSKAQLHKIGQSGELLGGLLRLLLKTDLSLMKNVFKKLGKSVLIPLELTSAASTTGSYSKENFWTDYDCAYNLK